MGSRVTLLFLKFKDTQLKWARLFFLFSSVMHICTLSAPTLYKYSFNSQEEIWTEKIKWNLSDFYKQEASGTLFGANGRLSQDLILATSTLKSFNSASWLNWYLIFYEAHDDEKNYKNSLFVEKALEK